MIVIYLFLIISNFPLFLQEFRFAPSNWLGGFDAYGLLKCVFL